MSQACLHGYQPEKSNLLAAGLPYSGVAMLARAKATACVGWRQSAGDALAPLRHQADPPAHGVSASARRAVAMTRRPGA